MRKSAPLFCALLLSLSARRAWIEILGPRIYDMSAAVALRKESVDRNLAVWAVEHAYQLSLSARRAWIEMQGRWQLDGQFPVALRKESVDRNRTPHQRNTRPIPSLSARRAWIEIFAQNYNYC